MAAKWSIGALCQVICVSSFGSQDLTLVTEGLLYKGLSIFS